MTKLLGIGQSAPGDWKLTETRILDNAVIAAFARCDAGLSSPTAVLTADGGDPSFVYRNRLGFTKPDIGAAIIRRTYSRGCSRSPRRTKNGVASIEIVIRTLASATR